MEFILSYNNNEGVMVFPVIVNGSVTLAREQDNPTFDGMTGQLQALGNTNLASFTVESIFPLHSYPWVKAGSWGADGWRYVETINAVRLRKIPFRAIFLDDSGAEIFNLPVSVEAFEYGLDKAKDISFRLEFREYRFAKTPTVESLPKQASAEGTAVKVVETQPVQTERQQAEESSACQMTMRSGLVVSSGRTIAIPSSIKQTGMIASMTYWKEPKKNKSWAAGTTQRALYDIWAASGGVTNAIATIRGYYLIATTLTFGNVGDGVVVFLEGGKTIKCIIGDSKGANVAYSPHAGETGNKYGHAYGNSGVDVIEWEYGNPRVGTNQANGDKLRAGLRAMGIAGCKVLKMINLGSWINQ